MEPAKIDWENLEWVFSMDDLYEHINAPKWVDFSAPDASIDDEAWFCRPDCNHPKTVEDFLNSTPPSKRSASVCENLPLGDRNKRDANLKRRGILQPLPLSSKEKKSERFVEDGENQNPNFSSTPSYQYNSMKAAIKSSTEKKKKQIDVPEEEKMPRLKSTLSARNLFGGGRDVLNQITEFCNELKKLAMRAKDRENAEKLSAKSSPMALKEREKERKPLLEVAKDGDDAMEKSSNGKEKLRRKKRGEFGDDAENIPLTVDVKNLMKSSKEKENLAQIRTNPPSPQCFSARKIPGKATPLKSSRCKPPEMGILQEKEKNGTDLTRTEGGAENINPGKITPVNPEREARTLDVFWFLKPCTLAT